MAKYYRIGEKWAYGNIAIVPAGNENKAFKEAESQGKVMMSIGIGFDYNSKTQQYYIVDEKYTNESQKNIIRRSTK